MTRGPRGGPPAAAALLAALVLVVLGSLLVGSVPLSPGAVWDALLGRGDASTVAIVRELRLPRALLGALVGGALAVSGAALQALLGNPLADPYLLGVSGGAACGTLVGALLGLGARGAWGSSFALPLAGFLGALLAVVAVGAGASSGGRLDRGRLLLAGVVVNALASAVLLFLLSLGDAARTQSFVFWMLGSLAGATPGAVKALAAYAALGLLLLVPLARAFDALALGEETAATLGIPVERVKRIAYLAASLLAAAAVATTGIIGFVGLLVPHAVRRLARGHGALLVLSFLGGGALLVASDTLARSLFAPAEISVGAVTALLGAPAFLILLRARP
ncbi:MAG TPA: iron ABC transporter permease [Thermoanaerobaculia bacterium]|nr:iron ABC transporter permease [Thermoanaerobaculia bacterium]